MLLTGFRLDATTEFVQNIGAPLFVGAAVR
jgi:hypothetical protein